MQVQLNEVVEHEVVEHEGWRILKRLNAGAHGEVYEAVKCDTNVVYAYKRFTNSSTCEYEVCVLKEVMRTGGHTHIIAPVEFLNEAIILPLYTRGDLLDHVGNQGIMTEYDAAKMLVKISSAVAHLHHNEIAHLDIKLENVLLDTNLEPILCDFGHAEKIESHGMCSRIVGTPHFSAPETLALEPFFDCRAADMWSLGMCTYVLCVGRYPASPELYKEIFEDKDADGSFLVSRSQRAYFSSGYLNIIDACLQIMPQKRSTAQATLLSWQQFLVSEEGDKCDREEFANDVSFDPWPHEEEDGSQGAK
jgi:serine/threonine protein kinase